MSSRKDCKTNCKSSGLYFPGAEGLDSASKMPSTVAFPYDVESSTVPFDVVPLTCAVSISVISNALDSRIDGLIERGMEMYMKTDQRRRDDEKKKKLHSELGNQSLHSNRQIPFGSTSLPASQAFRHWSKAAFGLL